MPLLPPGFLEAQMAALTGAPGAPAPRLVAASDAAAACGTVAGLSRWLCEHRAHMLWALAAEGAMLACVLAAYVVLVHVRAAPAEPVCGPELHVLPPCATLLTRSHPSCMLRVRVAQHHHCSAFSCQRIFFGTWCMSMQGSMWHTWARLIACMPSE